MAILDPQGYDVDDQPDNCNFHQAGLRLVAALFAQLDTLEQRVEALEERERARQRQAAA